MLHLGQKQADIYIPSQKPLEEVLANISHVAIGAHQDDIELMAIDGIEQSLGKERFLAIVVTDGRGSPRSGPYQDYSDDQMQQLRIKEQQRAADMGQYGAVVQLAYSSLALKQAQGDDQCVADLKTILSLCPFHTLYTHALFDRHQSHIAVVDHVLRAVADLPKLQQNIQHAYGVEVWGSLDWVPQDFRKDIPVADVSLLQELIGVFESQIAGGKRYDQAIIGRLEANATFSRSHQVDNSPYLQYAMDLMPVISQKIDAQQYKDKILQAFCAQAKR